MANYSDKFLSILESFPKNYHNCDPSGKDNKHKRGEIYYLYLY